ncbi:MAG: hypothetical protein PWP23_402 [Candidatus Sumerlaeota bacterium]|nr:hypothetical protein [Candidatus Sumerlaeota bacterium]
MKKLIIILLFLILAWFAPATALAQVQPWQETASSLVAATPLYTINGNTLSALEAAPYFRTRPSPKYIEDFRSRFSGEWKAANGRAILEGTYKYPNFEAFEKKGPLEWNENPFTNNTWEWYHHHLSTVEYLIAAYQEGGDDRYLAKALDIVKSWAKHNYAEDFPSEFSWNDQGTAYRLKRLTALFEISKEKSYVADETIADFLKLIYTHCLVLADETFFSKFTNHGFDQAETLYATVQMYPEMEGSEQLLRIARSRLKDEIDFMFTEEGVHVENSPAYHLWLSSKLDSLRATYVEFGDADNLGHLDGILDRANYYTAFITKPDGTLPPVGDTVLARPNPHRVRPFFSFPYLQYAATNGTLGKPPSKAVEFFPLSGYAVFRDKWHDSESFKDTIYIFFKCGFISHYHRQDDDLSFVLYGLGEDWLIDSGLYYYMEKDPKRIYVRSNAAHNVPAIVGASAKRLPEVAPPGTGIVAYGSGPEMSYVRGRTTVFDGWEIERKLEYHQPYAIELFDVIKSIGEHASTTERRTYFQIPVDKQITIDPDQCGVTVRASDGAYMTIKSTPTAPSSIQLFTGSEDPILGWRSVEFTVLTPCHTLVFSHPSPEGETHFRIELHPAE